VPRRSPAACDRRRGSSVRSLRESLLPACTSPREGSTPGSEGTGCYANACRSPGTCLPCRRCSTHSRSGRTRGRSCEASSHTSGSGCVRYPPAPRGGPAASPPRPSRAPGRRASLPNVWRARRKDRTPPDSATDPPLCVNPTGAFDALSG
jgi:hypothetical protein